MEKGYDWKSNPVHRWIGSDHTGKRYGFIQPAFIISCLALGLSTFSTAWSVTNQREGTLRAIRDEIRTLIIQMVEVHQSIGKEASTQDDQKIVILLSSVVDLEKRLPDNLTYAENVVMGDMTALHAYPPDAVRYYLKAVDTASKDLDRASALRRLGSHYRIVLHDFGKAHLYYQQSLAAYARENSDTGKYEVFRSFVFDAETYYLESKTNDVKLIFARALSAYRDMTNVGWLSEGRDFLSGEEDVFGKDPDFERLKSALSENGSAPRANP